MNWQPFSERFVNLKRRDIKNEKMKQTNTIVAILLMVTTIQAQKNYNLDQDLKLPILPIQIFWDDFGINIRMLDVPTDDETKLGLSSSPYLEKLTTDVIRVSLGEPDAPVVINLENYFAEQGQEPIVKPTYNLRPEDHTIYVEKRKLTLGSYDLPDAFVFEISNFSEKRRYTRQIFVIQGINSFLLQTDKAAKVNQFNNGILSVDLMESNANEVLLRGDYLELDQLEEMIPTLCQKYNDRFQEFNAFVCVRDCIARGSESQLEYVRQLVTLYNITDFNDEPIAFLDQIIMTKQGIGFLTTPKLTEETSSKKTEPVTPKYTFYKWGTFINLEFEKGLGSTQILIKNPYKNTLTFRSDAYFSNVELIQFLLELKHTILNQLN